MGGGAPARRRIAAQSQQMLRRRIALRVDAGVIQHIAALRHSQEAGALLKGLGAYLGYLQQLPPGGEGSVLLPVFDDVFGGGAIQARHPAQQAGGG